MRRGLAKAAVSSMLLFAAGCTTEFQSDQVKVKMQLPKGAHLAEETTAGGVPMARFSNGMEIRSVEKSPPQIDDARLEDLLKDVATQGGFSLVGSVSSSRVETLRGRSVVRWQLRAAEADTLVYFIPLEGRFVLLTLKAQESRYQELENHLELALETLRPL